MNRLMTLTVPALLMSALSTSALGYQGDGFGGDDESGRDFTEINFPGGSLSEYITVIKEAFDDDTSFMVLPPAEDFQVPAINGLISSPGVALDAIEGISMDLTYPNGRVYPTTINWDYIDPYILRIKPNKGRVSVARDEEPVTQSETTTQVYELAQLTGSGYSMENILGTMQVGFEMSSSGSPVIRFHEPTSVLFVKGDWKQLEILNGVLKALRSASDRATENEEREAKAQRLVQAAEEKVEMVEFELSRSREEYKELRNETAKTIVYYREEARKVNLERDRLEAQARNLEEVLQMFGPLEKTFAEYAKFQKQAEKNATPE